MDPPRQPELRLKLMETLDDELFRELSSAVKGSVLRPSDSEYAERTKTFNGKLKPLARAVVSPLDAHDVSAVVKFCAKHGLSPSVRAGGYGIAGWAVAGDVIIDMSKITDIDIEPPRPRADTHADAEGGGGEVDWTPLKDMPALRSKGKDRAPAPPSQASPPDGTSAQRPGKRRREDRSPSTGPDEMGSSTGRGPFDGASYAVASFLSGPPLPPEPGESTRQPPTNRQRLHSPEPESSQPECCQTGATGNGKHPTKGTPLEVPRLSENARQLSGESNSSDESSRQSALGLASEYSRSSFATTIASPPGEKEDGLDANPREPFAYLSSDTSTSPHPPMYGTTDPLGHGPSPESSSALPTPTTGTFFPPAQSWPMPPSVAPGTSSGVSAWNPLMGFGGMPSNSSPFSMPMSNMAMPPLMTGGGPSLSPPRPFGFPPSSGAIPEARTGHLGTMQHFKPVHPHAYVTFGAGMRQKEIDLYTADHPLEGTNAVTGEKKDAAVPYHVPMSAHPVGSSIMLLAGFGFISRMYGLSIDNVVEIEMVLADGRIIVVNAEEDPELWWAVRGAGPAFGIATRYKARAFPVPVVFAGNLIYRFHRATAPSLIKHFRDCIKNAPRELYANVLLTAGPADKDSLVVIQMCYVGPKEKGMEYLQAISSWDGERCLLNEVNEKSFLNQQDSVAQVLRGKAGRQWFLRSALITTLPDEVINKTVMEFADTPIGCTWLFELAGGAIADFEDTCLPKEQREATWTVAALHQWDMGVDDPRCITTAEQWMGGTIKQVSVGGPYPTFLGRHEPPARTMACYGKNWDRLAELKRKYDPDCLFKNNFWPLDKYGRLIEPLANEPPSP
ncbi:hypothetical protein OH77DRAFT_1430824 [Trametes cingulata]|nr:hypothetical protein OH77DRAFT_1430824 [Trametes cingulata]